MILRFLGNLVLSKEEEHVAKHYAGATSSYETHFETVKWLASKLLEVNAELKDLKNKHNQLDIMLAECLTKREQLKEMTKKYEQADRTLGNIYSNPKNDISDRWYPRD